MLVGWVTVAQAGQDDQSTAAMNRTTMIIELPEQRMLSGFTGRWWRAIETVAALRLVGTAVFGLVRGSPELLMLSVPALLVFLPGFQFYPYIVDDGIVFKNYFSSRVGLSTTSVSWDGLPGYRVENKTLVTERAVGSPFRFDREQVGEFDRVVEALESNI